MKQALTNGALAERLKMPARGELIAVHDNYRLWLMVLDSSADQPTIKAMVEASEGSVADTLAAALQGLRRRCPDIPKKVRLFSASVVMALLELPLDPAKTHKQYEMDNLIQWELEPLVGDANEQLTIGSILEGRQLMTSEQRREVAQVLEQRRMEGHGLARFGEIAQELALVSRDDVQSSLALQEFLRVSEPNLACSCRVQTLPGHQPVTDQPIRWWCCGIDRSIRQHWLDAFQGHGLMLTGIAPLAGATMAALAAGLGDDSAIVADILQEQLLISRVEAGVVTELQYLPRITGTSLNTQCVSSMLEVLTPQTNTVLMGCWTQECEAVSAEALPAWLEELGQEIERSPSLMTSVLPTSTLEMHPLIAALALSLHPKSRQSKSRQEAILPVIAANDPGPPVWKNPNIYRYGLPVLLLLGAMAHGVYSANRGMQLEHTLTELESEYQRQLEYNQKLAALNNETQKTTSSFLSVNGKLEALRTERSRIEKQVLIRTRQTPALLRAIAASVNEAVLLDGIAEPKSNSQGSVNLTAWATTELGATRFTETLAQQLERLGYQVTSRQINTGISRLGARGHTIDLWLVPADVLKQHEQKTIKQGTAQR